MNSTTCTKRQALLAISGVSKKEKNALRRERASRLEGLNLKAKLEALNAWNAEPFVS